MAARKLEPWHSLVLTGEEGKGNPTAVPENEQPVLGGRGDNPFSEAKERRRLEGES